MSAVDSRDAHERGVIYAEAYIAWVDSIRWGVDPSEWYDLFQESVQFSVTMKDEARGISRRNSHGKVLWNRLVVSSHLATAMYNSDFREVFKYDRMLKALSE